jgi:hypothetical protein
MTSSALRRVLHHHFLGSYVGVLALCAVYLDGASFGRTASALFATAVYLSYAALYLLPALLVATLARLALVGRRAEPAAWRTRAVLAIAVASTSLVGLLLYADRTLYALFGFHVNGFVLNLVLTPGGLESMGESAQSLARRGVEVAGLLAANALLAGACVALERGIRGFRPRLPRLSPRLAVPALLIVGGGQAFFYGVNDIASRGAQLAAASAFPFYQPLTFRRPAEALGLAPERDVALERVALDESSLVYPLEPLRVEAPRRPRNVVWLVAESLRADALDPEVMPATWRFAQRAGHYTNHLSGGNGTRMGMFSMFYGLPGAYWFSFLSERRSPVLLDVMQQQDYQLILHTSARFSYPEFDRTIFANVPDAQLHSSGRSGHNTEQIGPGWQHDRIHVSEIIDAIDRRDERRPFFAFMFFESSHSHYYFPPESVIRRPYLEHFDYASMKLEKDLPLIHNRYLNSCHHLDSQLGRLLGHLEASGLLDETIVVITGDHGEEFLEKGRWGHNSEFHEEQIRVPLVLWVPGASPAHVERMTSHLDLPATILPLLGVRNPAQDYSEGNDLRGSVRREYAVVADWSRMGLLDAAYKLSIPLQGGALLQTDLRTRDDAPIEEWGPVLDSLHGLLRRGLTDLSRFHRGHG